MLACCFTNIHVFNMTHETTGSFSINKQKSAFAFIDVLFAESGQIQRNVEVKGQEGEQLLKSEGHQVQMFNVTGVTVMHSGPTTSPKSIHVFPDL